MPRLAIHRLSMAHPGDLSALAALIDQRDIAAADIRAVIGKTEGNGGLNDFTRGFFTQSLMLLLAEHTGEDRGALTGLVPCVLSGGTEGALSPHYLVFSVAPEATTESGLAVGTAFSAPMQNAEIGRDAQISAVAQAVRAAMAEAGIAHPRDVALLQVKAPAGRGGDGQARTRDGRALMAYSRAAAAFGVGLALGDIAPDAALEAALLADLSLFTHRASISSGVEVVANEVIVFGTAPGWAAGITASVAPMQDLLDLAGVQAAFAGAPGEILGVIAKGEPDATGLIRGQRHTMLGDTDIDAQRHLRGALGAIVAAVAGDGRVFVSGGAEHQGPPGGGLVCVFARDRRVPGQGIAPR